MKKILVLATGGTIVSTAHKNGLAPGMTINQLSAFFDSAEGPIDFIPLMDKDSTNMQPKDWIKMSQTIRSHPDFDAYLITHGTDTMAYTAAGLSYLLSDFEKPVIITGSQIPLTFEHTDAKKNINDALLAVRTIDFPGVYAVFDGRVIAGTRAVKVKSKSFDAFDSINFPLIAQIENQQFKILYRPSFNPGPITSRTGLNTNIYVIRAFPGLSVKFFDFIEQEKAALIIESLGNGGLPSVGRNLVAGVEKLSQAGLPVIITTQIMNEGQDIDLYEVGQRVEQAGGITAGDMNTEAIVAKLMWTMRQTKNLSQIKNIMQTPIAHDLDHL